MREVVRVGKQDNTEPAGTTALLTLIRAAPAARLPLRVASIAQEGLQDQCHSLQGLQGLSQAPLRKHLAQARVF